MALSPLLNLITLDIGIDLGTANTLLYIKGDKDVYSEPTVVAVHKKSRTTVATGQQAKSMIGRTPDSIVTIQPISGGVISDFEATQRLIQHHIDQLHQKSRRKLVINKPRVVIGVPSLVTAVERRAVSDAARRSGAREVFIIDESMASAIGCGIHDNQVQGRLLIDIGGGTTEIAVVSFGGLVASKSIPIAGWTIDQAIINYAREKYQMLIGSQTAEGIKIEVGHAFKQPKAKVTMLRGRDISSGLPKAVRISSNEIQELIHPILSKIQVELQEVLEATPPEIAADISQSGATIAGGGALLPGIDKFFSQQLDIEVKVADNPLHSVISGIGKMLKDRQLLAQAMLPSTNKRDASP